METLIHTSAPSSRKDDERSRRQAENYEFFRPLKRARPDERVADGLENEDESHLGDVPVLRGLGLDYDTGFQPPTFVDDTQLAVSALESQILTESLKLRLAHSVLEIQPQTVTFDTVEEEHVEALAPPEPSNPRQSSSQDIATITLPNENHDTANRDSTNGSTEDVENDNQDTSPKPSIQLGSPYIAIKEGHTLALGHVGPASNDQNATPTRVDNTVASDANKRTHSSSWTGDDVPSQLPSTYSLSSEATSKGAGPGDEALQHSLDALSQHIDHDQVIPNGGIASTYVRVPGVDTTKNDDGQRTPSVRPGVTGHPSLTPASTTPISTPSNPPSADLHLALSSLTASIHPPIPPTSIESFETHVTPSLHSLASFNDLHDRYRPYFLGRPLRKSERGFWTFNPNDLWTLELQLEFWTFMQRVVSNGSAGWAVWVSRERFDGDDESEEGETDTEVNTGTTRSEVSNGLGTIKVFCFGEVVEHIYLLLYVASKSKIRRLDAIWVDAGEEAVVRMGRAAGGTQKPR